MSFLFNEFLFRPLFNVLVWIYTIIPGDDLGIAIAILTVLIRLILSPLSFRALRAQRALSTLQPTIRDLQEKYKDDRQALGRATMELYKERNINPFGGCLPLLIQLPVIFALYRVFISGLDPAKLNLLYPFIENPGSLNTVALGVLDISQSSPLLAVLTGVVQALHSSQTIRHQKKDASGIANNPALKTSQQMMYFFPILIVIISWSLPAGLVVYFLMTTIFSILEQAYIHRALT